jgi:ferredoxin
MTRITIVRDECVSCGSCADICPEVFELNPADTLSQVREKYRSGEPGEGEVPEELEDCVKEAADACPVLVIHLS